MVDAARAANVVDPPNPNAGLNQFVVAAGDGTGPMFDAASWANVAQSDASWASASWASASWASASWANASWASASWANASVGLGLLGLRVLGLRLLGERLLGLRLVGLGLVRRQRRRRGQRHRRVPRRVEIIEAGSPSNDRLRPTAPSPGARPGPGAHLSG